MINNKDPIVVTIRENQTVDQALEEKRLEKDLELNDRIEEEEKTKSESVDQQERINKKPQKLVNPWKH